MIIIDTTIHLVLLEGGLSQFSKKAGKLHLHAHIRAIDPIPEGITDSVGYTKFTGWTVPDRYDVLLEPV